MTHPGEPGHAAASRAEAVAQATGGSTDATRRRRPWTLHRRLLAIVACSGLFGCTATEASPRSLRPTSVAQSSSETSDMGRYFVLHRPLETGAVICSIFEDQESLVVLTGAFDGPAEIGTFAAKLRPEIVSKVASAVDASNYAQLT